MAERVAIASEAQLVLDQIAAQAAKSPKPDHALSEAERVAGVRAAYSGVTPMSGVPEPISVIRDLSIDGPNGPIPVRIYQCRATDKADAALIWLHGGSFISGDLETHDAPLRAIANRSACLVVAVAWRLAPEHPYPTGLEDAFAVLQALAGTTGRGLGIDPSRVMVGGDSAGGAVAASLTHLARERGGPAIAGQVLVYPNTDLSGDGRDYPSWAQNDGLVLTRSDMERNFALYAGGADRTHWGLSPLRASEFAGLPPALLITGEADPQRDEGEAYGAKLSEAGVPVQHTRVPGMIHGFLQMAGVLQAARDAIDEIGAWIRVNVTGRTVSP